MRRFLLYMQLSKCIAALSTLTFVKANISAGDVAEEAMNELEHTEQKPVIEPVVEPVKETKKNNPFTMGSLLEDIENVIGGPEGNQGTETICQNFAQNSFGNQKDLSLDLTVTSNREEPCAYEKVCEDVIEIKKAENNQVNMDINLVVGRSINDIKPYVIQQNNYDNIVKNVEQIYGRKAFENSESGKKSTVIVKIEGELYCFLLGRGLKGKKNPHEYFIIQVFISQNGYEVGNEIRKFRIERIMHKNLKFEIVPVENMKNLENINVPNFDYNVLEPTTEPKESVMEN